MFGAFVRTLAFALALFPALVNAQVSIPFPGPGMPASAGGRTCTDDTASTNFLARTSGLSNSQKDLYCNLIKGLESDGIITGTLNGANSGAGACGSILDVLYIFPTNTTTTANLNICGTSYTLTGGTPPTFVANQGYTGNGSSQFLSTNFAPGTATTPNFTQNSAHVGAYVLNSRTANSSPSNAEIGMANSGGKFSYLVSHGSTGNYETDINDNAFPTVATTNAQGAWSTTRVAASGAGAVNAYKNGNTTPILTNTGTSSAISGAITIALFAINNNGTTSNFSGDQLGAAWAGGALTATQAAAIENRINTFMSGLGINVY